MHTKVSLSTTNCNIQKKKRIPVLIVMRWLNNFKFNRHKNLIFYLMCHWNTCRVICDTYSNTLKKLKNRLPCIHRSSQLQKTETKILHFWYQDLSQQLCKWFLCQGPLFQVMWAQKQSKMQRTNHLVVDLAFLLTFVDLWSSKWNSMHCIE